MPRTTNVKAVRKAKKTAKRVDKHKSQAKAMKAGKAR
jgi:hypothetical protein